MTHILDRFVVVPHPKLEFAFDEPRDVTRGYVMNDEQRELKIPVHQRRTRSKSGLKGVFLSKFAKKKPWGVIINVGYKAECVGYFATKEEAARAYNKRALEIYGANTYLNNV